MTSSRKPLPEEIAEALAAEMRDGRLTPGAYLPPEPRLGARFGVSRPVVREGPEPNLGDALAARVRADARVLREIWDARMMIEPAVAAAAAERATREEARAIAEAAGALESADDPVGADLAFHAAVMRAAHNAVVAMILEPLGDLLRAERAATLRMGLGLAARGHARIADAIAAGDAAGARAAMERHLVEARAGLERAVGPANA